MIERDALARHLDTYLNTAAFNDYAPNGLQVEGRTNIETIVTGVSANQALIDAAIARGADALLVHHGFFWKNEPRALTGIRARRVRSLFAHGISLFGYHLPLDAHAEVGNNVGVLRAIGATPSGTFDAGSSIEGWLGQMDATPVKEVVQRVATACDQTPTAFLHGPDSVKRVGICTGGGAGFFEAAAAAGVDLFISGEPAEMSQGLARELGVHFVAAGHHATERFGPRALGEHLEATFALDVEFVDIPNPV